MRKTTEFKPVKLGFNTVEETTFKKQLKDKQNAFNDIIGFCYRHLKELEQEQLYKKPYEYFKERIMELNKELFKGISFERIAFLKEIELLEYKEMAEIGSYLLKKIKEIHQVLVPCHKDIYGPNFVLLANKMYLIDWEYSGMESRFFDYGDLCLQQNIEEKERKEIFSELKLKEGGDDQILWNLYRYLSSLTWGLWATRKGVLDEETDKDYLNLGKNKIKSVFEAVSTENFEKHLSRKY